MGTNADLLKRFELQKSERSTVQQIWDAIETYVTPYRGAFFNDTKQEGAVEWFKRRDSFDSTATMAHQNLAASIHGAVTNPGTRWFDLGFREHVLKNSKAANAWLQTCSEQIYYALQDSNFNVKINEGYQDLAGPGTAFVALEEKGGQGGDFGGLEFHAIPIKEAYFEPDHDGRCLRFYREREWTAAQILSKFGKHVPQSVIDLEKKGDNERQSVIYCVYPRNNKVIPIGEKVYQSGRPWEYRYILKKTGETIGKPGGFYEMPIFCPRWRLTSGSIWGNSPAHMAMQDILSLNEAMKIHLVSMAKLMDPPLLSEESAIIGDLNLTPAALTVLRNINGIKPLETQADIQASELTITRLQASVRNYFFNDQISFPDPQAQPMTATEAQIRYELMQRLLGPTLGRIQTELLDPIVSRTFRMMARAGALPEPPQIVVDEQAQFDIEYTGALSRAQRLDTATSIERFLGTVQTIAQSPQGEGALDNIDFNQVTRKLAHNLNVPAALLKDEAEVAQVQEARRQAEARVSEAKIGQEEGAAQEAGAEAA